MSKEEFINKVLPLRLKLENYAFNFLRNREEVEDVVQEVYIKLWCMRQKLDEYNSIDALSYTITKNLSINYLKLRQRYSDTDCNIEQNIEYRQPEDILIDKDSLARTLSIIEQLPNLQQAILKMKHIEELEITEIAELIGCNEGAIRTNLSRARNRVKTLFLEMNK